MAVRTRKRGKTWSYSFDIEPGPDGKRRMKEKGGFSSKEEAFTAGAAAYTDWKNGNIGLTSDKILLRDYLEKWFNLHQKDLKPNSVKTYNAAIESVNRYLGSILLQELKPRDIDLFFRKLCDDENKAYRTIQNIKTVLSNALTYAVYPLELISYNASTAIKIPKRAKKQVVKRYIITSSDLNKLLTLFPFGSSYHIPIILAYYTGLRLGELLGLSWDNVHLDTSRIDIVKQLIYIPGTGFKFQSLKTDTSKRSIILDKLTVGILRKWSNLQKQYELKAGLSYVYVFSNENDFAVQYSKGITPPVSCQRIRLVCTRPDGKLINRDSFSQALRKNGFNSHSFRHTHATRLIENMASPKSVAARLGHKSTAITENLYTHNTDLMQKQVADITEHLHEKDVDKPAL